MSTSELQKWIRSFREDLRLRDTVSLTRHVEEAGLEVMLDPELLTLACQQEARSVVVLIASVGEANSSNPATYRRCLAAYQYLQNQISLEEAVDTCSQKTRASRTFFTDLLTCAGGLSKLDPTALNPGGAPELDFGIHLLANTGHSQSIYPLLKAWQLIDKSGLPWLKACRAVISRASCANTKAEMKELADTIEGLIALTPENQSDVHRQLHIEWARISFESGIGTTAVKAAEQALALTEDPEDRFMLAKSLILAGRMHDGINHLETLLSFTLDHPASFDKLEPKVPFNVSDAEETLILANEILQNKGLQPFLMAGTLLGCIRDGQLLPHDKDVDIGLIGWEHQFTVAQALIESGAFHIDLSEVSGENRFVLAANDIRNGTAIDFFFFHDMDDHYLQGINFDIGFLLNLQFSKFGLQKINFHNREFFAPDNIDLYLAENYDDWRTPVSSYLITVESPALAPDPLPRTVLIYLETIKTIMYNMNPKRMRRILNYIEKHPWFSFNPLIHSRLHSWCIEKEQEAVSVS
jgi:hypothetical protein